MAAGTDRGVMGTPAWTGAEASEGERSEAERDGAKVHAGRARGGPAADSTEVAPRARRRTFTAEDKLRILSVLMT
jgi:hypothetical protein